MWEAKDGCAENIARRISAAIAAYLLTEKRSALAEYAEELRERLPLLTSMDFRVVHC